jgi:Ankyrin repeats (3 copies)
MSSYSYFLRLASICFILISLIQGGLSQAAPSKPFPVKKAPLSAEEQLDYDTYKRMFIEAMQKSGVDRSNALNNFLYKSYNFAQAHPNSAVIWLMRAEAALKSNEQSPSIYRQISGHEAAQHIKVLNLYRENNSAIRDVILQLNEKGWFKETSYVSNAPDIFDAFWWSIRNDRLGYLEALIESGANINARGDVSSRFLTPLHVAVEEGKSNYLKTLIASGADVNAKDLNGLTPLAYAALYGEIDCLKILIASGADINAKNREGTSVVHFAVCNPCQVSGSSRKKDDILGKVDCLQALLVSGADINARGAYGATPLDQAIAQHATGFIKILKQSGAHRNFKYWLH